MRTLVLTAAILAASVAMSALGPRYGGDLIVGLPGPDPGPRLLAPADPAVRALRRAAHESLLGVGPDGLPQPALASGWYSAASGREWTLVLAGDLRFHDGLPVDAEAAVRSLRAFLRSGSTAAAVLAESLEGGSEFAAGAAELTGLSAADAGRIVLRLQVARARPFAPLAAPAAAIVSENGAGCGPFVPPAGRAGPRGLKLTAFPDHRAGRPFLDSVTLRFGEATPHAEAFGAGRLDVAPGVGTEAAAASLLLQLDASHPVLAVASTRRSLAAAFDRAGLSRFAAGSDAAAPLLPPTLLPPLPWPREAGDLRVSGRLRLAVDRGIAPSVSQRVVAHLTAAGFDVDVLPVWTADIWEARADARLLIWLPEVPEAGLALRELARHTRATDAISAQLETAERERDEDRRRLHLHEIENELLAESEIVPLLGLPVAFSVRNGVHGVRVDASGALLLDEAWREP